MTFHNRLRSQKPKIKGHCDHRSGRCSSFSGQCSWHGLFHLEHIKKPTLFGNSLGSTLGFLHFQWTVVQRDPALGCSVSSTVDSHWFYISWGSALCSGYFFGGVHGWGPLPKSVDALQFWNPGWASGSDTKILFLFFFFLNPIEKSPTPNKPFPPSKIQCAVIWNREDHSVLGSPVGAKAHV